MRDLFKRRMIVVTGKGGVGRTTVSAALGLAAGKAGKRVAIVELSGMANLAPIFGLRGRSYAAREVAKNVDILSMTALECLDDFGIRKLRLTALVRMVMRSRVVQAFLDAVPGLHDLLQLGKLENMLLEPLPDDTIYDLMVLDAPATGHGLTLLSAARSMREMTRVGPFAELARGIEVFLANREISALILVTLPEALPVNESLELRAALQQDGADLEAIVVNMVEPSPLPEDPPWEEAEESLASDDPELQALVETVGKAMKRHSQQQKVLVALADAIGSEVRIHQLPRIGHGSIDPTELEVLRDELTKLGEE